MRKIAIAWCLVLIGVLVMSPATAAKKKDDSEKDEGPFSAGTFKGLALRGTGPGLVSGRITDIAVHPDNHSIYYATAASGGRSCSGTHRTPPSSSAGAGIRGRDVWGGQPGPNRGPYG